MFRSDSRRLCATRTDAADRARDARWFARDGLDIMSLQSRDAENAIIPIEVEFIRARHFSSMNRWAKVIKVWPVNNLIDALSYRMIVESIDTLLRSSVIDDDSTIIAYDKRDR